MAEEVHSMVYGDKIILANSKKAVLEAAELEMLKDSETRFLSKEATEEYLEQLIEKYGSESEQVKLLKQRIKESFGRKE